MKCEKVKNRILLEQSGELSWWSRHRMRSHLARCAPCRTFRQELLRLTDAVRRVPWEEGFPAARAPRVTAAAPRREREPALNWQPAFAYAALSVFLALVFVLVMQPFHRPPEAARAAAEAELAWDADLEDRITDLDNLINSADTEWMDGLIPFPENGDTEAIARQLLALEGEHI